jgi:YteA family regulatory protein
MDRQKLDYFKEKLYEEKRRIFETIKNLDEDMGLVESIQENTSELSVYDNHPGDIGSETFEVEKNWALKSNELNHMKMINDALVRIGEGKYGICERCNKEIDEDRLDVVPYTNRCIECEDNEPNYKTYWQDRPIEETVIGYPFGSTNMDDEDYTGYDGEDVWQELESYNSLNYNLWDEEDEDMQGIVEEVDKISNAQYRSQLPD